MSIFWTTTGAMVHLGTELGRGGEGVVYEVHGQPDVVAKVYHQAVDSAKAQKLEAMAALPPGPLHAVSAWPRAALQARPSGPVQGFIMPAVRGHKAAHLLYSPRSRRSEFAGADYKFLVHVAGNVARAFAVVHQQGHVIGDVNHSGVLVGADGTAHLIDCDSFQVSLNGRTYRCAVGVPEYTPPELQGVRLSDVHRTTDHDAFGLAVMVFHVLFMGRHPFAGRYLGSGPMPVAQAIREGRFAFGPGASRSGMAPPPHAPVLRSASDEVADLFVAAFSAPGRRPAPARWASALSSLAGELVTCSHNGRHVHWRGLSTCPWCQVEAAAGTSFFGGQPAGGATQGHFYADVAWREISAVPLPTEMLKPTASPQPSQRALELRREIATFRSAPPLLQSFVRLLALTTGVALALATAALFGVGSLWALVTGVLAFWVIDEGRRWRHPLPKSVRSRMDKMKAELALATETRRKTGAALQALGSSHYDRTLAALRESRERLSESKAEEAKALAKVRADAKADAQKRHLSRFAINAGTVKGVGNAKVQALASRGVRTAADINRRNVRSVPGIGTELAGRLETWKRGVERSFRFNPDRDIDSAALARISAKFAQERQTLERHLSQGATALRDARARTEAERGPLVAAANTASARVSQMESDLRHLKQR